MLEDIPCPVINVIKDQLASNLVDTVNSLLADTSVRRMLFVGLVQGALTAQASLRRSLVSSVSV